MSFSSIDNQSQNTCQQNDKNVEINELSSNDETNRLKTLCENLTEENKKLKEKIEELREEISDLDILYDGSIEHGVAIENLLDDKNKELEKTQARLSKELKQASNYLESLFPEPIDSPEIRTNWIFLPSTELGGDSFGYHWIDDDHFAIYLLDVCGHGVGASLLSASVIHMIRKQALKNVDFREPASVFSGLNENFQMDQQNQMFFTIWYGVFNKKTRSLNYATAGHPPAFLLNCQKSENKLEKLITKQMIIGYEKCYKYEQNCCQIPKNSSLFIFSDGVFELNDETRCSTFGFDDLEKFFSECDQNCKLTNIVDKLKEIQGSDHFCDDFSIIKVDFL